MQVKKGRCLCGQVSYEYTGQELRSGYCHCESCRRATSSPLTSFLGVLYKNFSFTGVLPKVYESSPGTRRLFCGQCGSPMGFEADRYADKIHLFAASLEQPNNYVPTYHGHVDEKLDWVEISDDLPQYGKSGGVKPS